MIEVKWQMSLRIETKRSVLVDISTMTDKMYHELMLVLVRRIDNPIAPDAELVECSQLTCEFPGRKIAEVLRQPLQFV